LSGKILICYTDEIKSVPCNLYGACELVDFIMNFHKRKKVIARAIDLSYLSLLFYAWYII